MCCTKFQVIWVKQTAFIAVFLTWTKMPLLPFLRFKSPKKAAWFMVNKNQKVKMIKMKTKRKQNKNKNKINKI